MQWCSWHGSDGRGDVAPPVCAAVCLQKECGACLVVTCRPAPHTASHIQSVRAHGTYCLCPNTQVRLLDVHVCIRLSHQHSVKSLQPGQSPARTTLLLCTTALLPTWTAWAVHDALISRCGRRDVPSVERILRCMSLVICRGQPRITPYPCIHRWGKSSVVSTAW
jgi:hypothetical protein